jgi:hypothetical protein
MRVVFENFMPKNEAALIVVGISFYD